MSLTPAQRDLVEQAIPMIWDLVRRRPPAVGFDADDLFQAAALAICQAVPRFDPARSSWSTFVYRRAHGAIIDHIRDNTWGKRAARSTEPIVRLDDLAKFYNRVSINSSPIEDNSTAIFVIDQFSIPSDAEDREPWIDLERALHDATPRERFLYEAMRHDLPRASTASACGVTDSQICRDIQAFRAKYRHAVEEVA